MHIKLNVKKKKFESFSSWEQKKQNKTKTPSYQGIYKRWSTAINSVSINGDYTVTFTSAAVVSLFLIIMQYLVGFVADTLLLRGQLAEKWIH